MGNCTKPILPKGEHRRRIHGCCSRYWHTGICVGSTPAGSWRRHDGIALTSDGCRRTGNRRITAPWRGFVPDAARKRWRSCFTSLSTVQGRKLYLRRETTQVQDGQLVSAAWYRCEECGGCPHRTQCCRAKVPDKPKESVLKKTFWEKRELAPETL